MGSKSSKPRPERNAVQFRIYSFWDHGDSYERCLQFAESSRMADKISVTRLNDDITFVACYRIQPFRAADIKAIEGELKGLMGSPFGVDLCV